MRALMVMITSALLMACIPAPVSEITPVMGRETPDLWQIRSGFGSGTKREAAVEALRGQAKNLCPNGYVVVEERVYDRPTWGGSQSPMESIAWLVRCESS